jgi:flagellar hook assembly protein FlgD
VDVPLGIGPGTPRYTRYVLDQNHPNPFNPVTIIHYEIPDAAGNVHVTLAVYDVVGRLVRILVDGPSGAGPHDVEWDATNAFGERVSSGVYFYVMRAAGVQLAKKMVVLE